MVVRTPSEAVTRPALALNRQRLCAGSVPMVRSHSEAASVPAAPMQIAVAARGGLRQPHPRRASDRAAAATQRPTVARARSRRLRPAGRLPRQPPPGRSGRAETRDNRSQATG
jgi:hypothetical protein